MDLEKKRIILEILETVDPDVIRESISRLQQQGIPLPRGFTPLNSDEFWDELLRNPGAASVIDIITSKPITKDSIPDAQAAIVTAKETDILSGIPPERNEYLKEGIYSIDPKKLTEWMKRTLFEPEAARLILQITQEYLRKYQTDENMIRLHVWLRNMRYLAEGAIGAVLTTSPSPLYAVKTLKDMKAGKGAIHEYLIAKLFLNDLRNNIPNFNYSYAYIGCSAPIIHEKHLVDWCVNSYPDVSVPYIINELLVGDDGKPLRSLEKWLVDRTLEYDEIFLIYLQVLFALEMAHKACLFTHYDLHANNILIYHSQTAKVIGYPGRGSITTHYIPIIIDYGYSYYNYNGVGYSGVFGLEYGGVLNVSYPMYDIWKLTIYLAMNVSSLSSTDDELYHMATTIIPKQSTESKSDYLALLNKVWQKTQYGYPIIGFASGQVADVRDVINGTAQVSVQEAYSIYKDVTYTDFINQNWEVIARYVGDENSRESYSSAQTVMRDIGVLDQPINPKTIFAVEDMILDQYHPEDVAKLFESKRVSQLKQALFTLSNVLGLLQNPVSDPFELIEYKNNYEYVNYMALVIQKISLLYGKDMINDYTKNDIRQGYKYITDNLDLLRQVSDETTRILVKNTMKDYITDGYI